MLLNLKLHHHNHNNIVITIKLRKMLQTFVYLLITIVYFSLTKYYFLNKIFCFPQILGFKYYTLFLII